MFTSRVIGAIELQCWFLDWPIWKQTAQNAKKFMTDERLKEWGMWEKGKRHARDAIRHGCFWLAFTQFKAQTDTDTPDEELDK